jgi:2-iminobutanoate/2-iminopropanoate deaminase
MNKISIHTHEAPAAIGPYSQAVRVGDLIFVSGQIPMDPATGNLVEGDIETQTHRVMKNIKAILEASGCDFTDIVKSSIFIADMNDFSRVNEVYATYFNGYFPARETVQVSRLPKDARIEISVIAAL